ncbi:hypothetical protein T492DRAFT_876814, partial [Pavlovales sp. CCMP2436]
MAPVVSKTGSKVDGEMAMTPQLQFISACNVGDVGRVRAEFDGANADVFLSSLDWTRGGDDGAAVVTRAPGRLDVMGGIADYSGSLVLQLPLREGNGEGELVPISWEQWASL